MAWAIPHAIMAPMNAAVPSGSAMAPSVGASSSVPSPTSLSRSSRSATRESENVVSAAAIATAVNAAPTPVPERPRSDRCNEPSVCMVVPAMASTISATLADSSQESSATVRRLSRSGTCSCFGPCTSGSRAATTPSSSTSTPRPPIAALMPTSCTTGPPKIGPTMPPIGSPVLMTAAVLARARAARSRWPRPGPPTRRRR